jgi:hypothetical protein
LQSPVLRTRCARDPSNELVNDGPKPTCRDLQSSQCDRQVETPWPGASGIQIEHPANSFDPRSMRVAGNDHVNSARRCIDLQFLKVVQDVEGPFAEPHHLSVGIVFRPVTGIDVSSNRSDRRNPTEPHEDVRATNIAGVDDMRHAGELSLSLGPQETVGVRDDSNPQHWASIPQSMAERPC